MPATPTPLEKMDTTFTERFAPRPETRCGLIGQIKKNQNSRAVAVSRQGVPQTSSKASFYDIERSGQPVPKKGNEQPNLLFDLRRHGSDLEVVEPDGIEPTT